MRKIEFIPNINGVTKILLDSIELKTRIDPRDIHEYRYNRAQYNLPMAYHIIETALARLGTEVVLTTEESLVVIKYLKRELGI